ncbi:DUF357 domain-containing protein [archaeon]|jgi:uncharacterized protein|nr:DUF357 domain-containing protein [archaeon]MBT6182971.1 DUF357 domain-containing protein [archaeon]MBT6606564.1 DUF357 domain-containing protein [archaeon]MBT7251809.1 DUF357 domain-containing protein [archaeon]MBT7660780.1 DUF357 domain-containing protein [archaeon]
MENKITEEKLEKYFSVTNKAFEIAKKNILPSKEKHSQEIIDMVTNYISDANHFRQKDDFVNAFAALNYAHGWIDAGVRLDIFDVDDDKLFTVK